MAGVDDEFGVAPTRVRHEREDREETAGATTAEGLAAYRGRAKQVEAPGEI